MIEYAKAQGIKDEALL
jgi:histone arginine demethylase JMJD6